MRYFSRWILKRLGWTPEGTLPQIDKYIIIIVPHTSMLDFFLGRLFLFSLDLKVNVLVKKELFFFPAGILLKKLGGIPVDRSKRSQTIARMVEHFQTKDKFILAIAPEGTRQKVESWRTGFYYMASDAHVPIIPAFCDYKRKVFGIGPAFEPTGNMENDIMELKSFFRHVTPYHPDRY